MASVRNVLRTCGLIICIVLNVCAVQESRTDPWIVSVSVIKKTCAENNCKYLLVLRGNEFLGHVSWRITPREGAKGSSCDVFCPNYELRELESTLSESDIELVLPEDDAKVYFCAYRREDNNSPLRGQWIHQGGEIYLDPKNLEFSSKNGEINAKPNLQNESSWDLSHDTDVNRLPNLPRLTRNEQKDMEVYSKGKYIPLNSIDNDNKKEESQKHKKRSIQSVSNRNNDKNLDYYKNNDNDDYRLIESEKNLKTQGDKKGIRNDDTRINLEKSGIFNENDIFNENYYNNENSLKEFLINNDDDNLVRKKRSEALSLGKQKELNDTFILNNEKTINENVNKSHSDELISAQDIIEAKLRAANDVKLANAVKCCQCMENYDENVKIRKQRQVTSSVDFTSVKAVLPTIRIEGIRVEDSDKEPKIIEDGIPSVLAESRVALRVFGEGLTPGTVIAFTYEPQKYGEPCKFINRGEYLVKPDSLTPRTGLFEITAPPPIQGSKLYICAKNLRPNVEPFNDEEKYIHQGAESFKILGTHNKLLPLWVSLTLILVCLMFSALFSGLNLGLMSLDRTELKIISNTGTEKERKYARAIMPVRDHGNYLLCSILLGNVAVNSTFTILLDELTSGLFAVIFSTLAIVLLGEITPQAICSRHGLMVGAKSIVVTKAVMALTAPLAFPVSKLLDYFLGEEIGSVYNRERLKELVKVTTDVNDLDKDEVNIISGALELRKKTVSDVMTKLEDVFMLPITSVLDFETMSEIVKSGYSRIPVYEGHRGNIVTVLFIKDLAFVDPDDNTPLRTLCQYYQNPCNFVFEDVTLDVMFKQFKDGHKGHMAFVHRINNEGEGDPFYETIGLVTLEDVIEEMIQAEIVDETDVFMDNRTKRRRNRPANKLQDFAAFAERHDHRRVHISPQLTLATFQFLATSVDAFRPDTVSETVLRRLLKQDVIQYIKLKGKCKKDPSTYVYHQGKPVDYFVLILEGRVEVTVGRENLVFEAGPFTYFGVQALMQNVGVAESPTPSAMGSLQNINMDSMLRHTFVPDYSVRAITELYYLTVKRSLYLAAKRATLMEKGALSKGATNEQFDTEVDKHICSSSNANIPISMISKKLLIKSTSTASTRDDLGSTSTANKQPPRINIIELMQVTPQTNYDSDGTRPISRSDDNRLANSWPNSGLVANMSPPNVRTYSWDDRTWEAQDSEAHSTSWNPNPVCKTQSYCVKRDDLDANSCAECIRNNFWIKQHDAPIDTSSKKKKTTFHADSSLLTFHNLPDDEYSNDLLTKNTETNTNRIRTDTKNTKTDTDLQDVNTNEFLNTENSTELYNRNDNKSFFDKQSTDNLNSSNDSRNFDDTKSTSDRDSKSEATKYLIETRQFTKELLDSQNDSISILQTFKNLGNDTNSESKPETKEALDNRFARHVLETRKFTKLLLESRNQSKEIREASPNSLEIKNDTKTDTKNDSKTIFDNEGSTSKLNAQCYLLETKKYTTNLLDSADDSIDCINDNKNTEIFSIGNDIKVPSDTRSDTKQLFLDSRESSFEYTQAKRFRDSTLIKVSNDSKKHTNYNDIKISSHLLNTEKSDTKDTIDSVNSKLSSTNTPQSTPNTDLITKHDIENETFPSDLKRKQTFADTKTNSKDRNIKKVYQVCGTEKVESVDTKNEAKTNPTDGVILKLDNTDVASAKIDSTNVNPRLDTIDAINQNKDTKNESPDVQSVELPNASNMFCEGIQKFQTNCDNCDLVTKSGFKINSEIKLSTEIAKIENLETPKEENVSTDWRREKNVLEKKLNDMENQVMSQLSKILKILEKKDQT